MSRAVWGTRMESLHSQREWLGAMSEEVAG